MAKRVEAKDIQAALEAVPVATEAGFVGGSKNVGPQPLPQLADQVQCMAGKKLKRNVSVVRNGREFYFKAGTAWEEIAEQYKTGLGKVNFLAGDFE